MTLGASRSRAVSKLFASICLFTAILTSPPHWTGAAISSGVAGPDPRRLASEGLYTEGLPPGLARPWKATALLLIRDASDPSLLITAATAFAIKKELLPSGQIRITFLTDAHNVKGRACGDTLSCDDALLSVAVNYALDMADNSMFKTAPVRFEVSMEFPTQSQQDDARDLALISGFFTAAQASEIEVQSLKCASQCETPGTPVFQMGFPAVQHRTSSYQTEILAEPLKIKKRWSQGFITETYSRTDAVEASDIPMATSTADSLRGNSGSPVVTGEGALCGIYAGGLIDGSDHYRFMGDDEKLRFHSMHTTCRELNLSPIFRKVQP